MALDDPATSVALAALVDAGENDMNDDWNVDSQGPWPTRFIVRIIDLKEVPVIVGQDPELHACFRDNLPPQPLPAGGITQAIKDLFKPNPPISNPFLVPRSSTAEFERAYPRTPLDLELLGEPIYVVYILGRPTNMYFRPDVKALTHKNPQDKPYYGALRHIKASATTYEEDEFGPEDCVIVSFIANPPEPPTMPPPPEFSYRHGFNLHLRLTQPASGGSPRALDIDIDPDIRYPGQ